MDILAWMLDFFSIIKNYTAVERWSGSNLIFHFFPFSSNLHIVWQYVARLLPVSVKSQDESSQQVDGLEMRSLSEDISKL